VRENLGKHLECKGGINAWKAGMGEIGDASTKEKEKDNKTNIRSCWGKDETLMKKKFQCS